MSAYRAAWKWPIGIVCMMFIALLSLLNSGCIQNRLVFPGSAHTQAQHRAHYTDPPGAVSYHIPTADGTPITLLWARACDPAGHPLDSNVPRPAVLFFYGNGSCLAWSLYLAEGFRRCGYHVLIPEFVGYGLSGGSPSESACYATADAAWEFLLHRPEVDPQRIVAAGWSLGGAVAIDLALRRPVAGLMTFCTFTTMPDMAQVLFPYLPASWLLTYRFDNLAKIRDFHHPIFLAHGMRDEMVPPAMLARLASQAGGPVTQYVIPEAGHANFFHVQSARTWQAVNAFLHQTLGPPPEEKKGF